MRPKNEERTKARELRRRGWPVRRIANELDVAVSSVSVWVREITLPPKLPSPVAPSAKVTEPSGEVKTCGRCRRELPVESFSRHPEVGRQHWCKDCFREYFRKRGSVHHDQTAAGRVRRRIVGREFIAEYLKSHPCCDCGESDRTVLEFDHTGEKRGTVSVLLRAGWSVKRLKQEIALCEVVCVNCHRRRTARRGRSWRTNPWSLDQSTHLLAGERRNMQLVRDTLMAFPYADCGLRDLLVLEFDHVGPKRGNVVQLARGGCSLMNLERELANWEIRCGNCHRRRTKASYEISSYAA